MRTPLMIPKRSINILPIMIAPIFGGMLIDRFGIISGVRIAVLLSILLSGVTILVQWQLRAEPKEEIATDERWNIWRSWRGFNVPMRRLLFNDVLARFCLPSPYPLRLT